LPPPPPLPRPEAVPPGVESIWVAIARTKEPEGWLRTDEVDFCLSENFEDRQADRQAGRREHERMRVMMKEEEEGWREKCWVNILPTGRD